MTKLNPENPIELQQMLHAGMGRAILFLMNQDTAQYRDVILDACLHNYAYDKQCEDERADYLYPLIKASGEIEYYRENILSALPLETDYYDAEQLLDFAVLFARDGCEQARSAIYDKLHRRNTDALPRDLSGVSQIIELDGISGLIHCLEYIESNPDLIGAYQDDMLIWQAEEVTSIEEVRLALIEAVQNKPAVARMLASINEYSIEWTAEEIVRKRKEMRGSHKSLSDTISSETTWQELKKRPEFRRLLPSWSRVASDSEFERAALDLESFTDPKQLAAYLRLFVKRPFPLDPNKLIKLVDYPDEGVVWRALTDLETIHHPDVRALFMRIIEVPELSDQAIGLLRSNYETGDDQIIMRLLEAENDLDNLHALCGDTNHTYQENPVPEGNEPLLLVYEKVPCALCRHTCLEIIQSLAEIPDWMIEECRYDSNSGTRELAESLAIV